MVTAPSPIFSTRARPRTRWHRFRLDMTPMVDLAFLLLTFFLLHTTTTKSHLMQLSMPVKGGYYGRSIDDLREHGAITILLGRNHELHYYYGLNNPFDTSTPAPELKNTDFSAQGIRQVLLTQDEPFGTIVFIKPTADATYKDVVDILDEMNITKQKKYALVKIAENDTELFCQAGY